MGAASAASGGTGKRTEAAPRNPEPAPDLTRPQGLGCPSGPLCSPEMAEDIAGGIATAAQGAVQAGQQVQVFHCEEKSRNTWKAAGLHRQQPPHHSAGRKAHGIPPAVDAGEQRLLRHGRGVFPDFVDDAPSDLLILQGEQCPRVPLGRIGVDDPLPLGHRAGADRAVQISVQEGAPLSLPDEYSPIAPKQKSPVSGPAD